MPKSRSKRRPTGSLLFGRRNYILLAVGALLVALGFALMRIENEFLGFISLWVAPLLILGGYAEIFYAIMWKPTPDDAESSTRTG